MSLKNDAHTEERTIIDDEIAQLTHQLCELKSRRNRLARISRLPPELLIRIFYLVQSGAKLDDESYYRWTAVTLVSSQWRDVALQTVGLWGNIVQSNPQIPSPWAIASFARAGRSVLEVYMPSVSIQDPAFDFALSVLSEIHRIRILRLSVSSYNSTAPKVDILQKYLEQPASLLQEASIRIFDNETSSSLKLGPLFGGNAPVLRKTRLSDVTLDWKSSPLRNITSLELSSFCSGRKISIPEFLDILSMIRRLKELILDERFFVGWVGEVHAGHDRIPLRHLTTLKLKSRWEPLIMLFSLISIPPQTQIDMFTWLQQDAEWKALFQPLSTCFIDEMVNIGRLDIHLNKSGNESFLRLWGLSEEPYDTRSPLINFRFTHPDPKVCDDAIRCFPTGHLEFMYLSQDFPARDWQIPNFSFPVDLLQLTVEGGFVGWLLDYLQENPNSLAGLQLLSMNFDWTRDLARKLKNLSLVIETWRGQVGGKLKLLRLSCRSPQVVDSKFYDFLTSLEQSGFVEMTVLM